MAIDATVQAFILVIAAGAATAIGSAVVFFPSLAHLGNRKVLAGSLGLAAGVMLYVSLVDIYTKSIEGYEEVFDEGLAFIYATLSFFGGCFLMIFLGKLVHCMLGGKDVDEVIMDLAASKIGNTKDMEDPANQAAVIEELGRSMTHGQDIEKAEEEFEIKQSEQTDLKEMGFGMALAIAIHNFPEGLVTFISYIHDPAVGIALAVGIAIHNIPEGLCVAMPVFYASGKRCYAFWWGVLSGATEPLGAIVGWLVFRGNFGGVTYGVMFGLVSGMMTIISVEELIPTARRYDPHNEVTTWAFLFGAFMIALSLMLFEIPQ